MIVNLYTTSKVPLQLIFNRITFSIVLLIIVGGKHIICKSNSDEYPLCQTNHIFGLVILLPLVCFTYFNLMALRHGLNYLKFVSIHFEK